MYKCENVQMCKCGFDCNIVFDILRMKDLSD